MPRRLSRPGSSSSWGYPYPQRCRPSSLVNATMLHNAHEMPSIVSALFLIQFCLNHLLRHPARACPPCSTPSDLSAVALPSVLCVLPRCALETCPSVSSQCNSPSRCPGRISLESFYILLPSLPGIRSGATCQPASPALCESPPVVHYYFVLSSLRRSKQPLSAHSRRPRETSALVPQSPRHPRFLPFLVSGVIPPAQLRPTSPGLWFLDLQLASYHRFVGLSVSGL